MSLKTGAAQATSAVLTWGLRHVAHRPAANLPGDVALKVDPAIVEHLRGKVSEASVMVVGTNGKTSVSNLLADALQLAGKSVICNRTGPTWLPASPRRCCSSRRASGACSSATSCGWRRCCPKPAPVTCCC